jgi:hypothetical protein
MNEDGKFPDRFTRTSVTMAKAFGLIPSAVFGCIWSLSEGTTDGITRATHEYIGKTIGVSESTVGRAIKLLLGKTEKNKIPFIVDLTKNKNARLRNYSPHYANFEEFAIKFLQNEKRNNPRKNNTEIDLKVADTDLISSFIDDLFE